MKCLTILTLVLAVLSGLNTGCVTGSRASRSINFDSTPVGAFPVDFAAALTGDGGPVSWVVRQDESRHVLVQESAEVTNYRFPLCIYLNTEATDVSAEVQFKSVSGTLDQAGGIVLRYTPGNYYIARANALEDNVILFKTVKGQRSKIEEVPAKVAPRVWHALRFEAKGNHLTIIFDGKTLIDKDDTTFSNAGKVGLWTKADSVSMFKDFKIEPVR